MTKAAIASVAAALAAAALGAGATARPSAQLTVHVLYAKRACKTGAARPATVIAGTLVLDRKGNGRPVRVSLLDGGPARVSIAGVGPVTASLVLETPRVRVLDGASSTVAIRVPLGKDTPDHGRLVYSVGRDEEDNAHVNALIVLQRAARLAAVTAPRQLPLLLARVYGGAASARPGPAFDAPRTIHAGDAEWEPTPLAHEYGHFLLHEIAPDGDPGGDHHAAKSYPARPNLAWSEGFPSTFAALVLDEGAGSLFVECGKPYQNLAAQPAEPQLLTVDDRRYAQYNETRVAAAAYQLVVRLGGRQAGLKRLLQALTSYRRAGHSVWTARDLRDLAARQFEQNRADHVAIDRIFAGQRLSWFRSFGLTFDLAGFASSGANSALPELAVRVTGPGLSCAAVGGDALPGGTLPRLDDGSPVPGIKAADGGLAFSADDDCYLLGGDGVDNPVGKPPALNANVVLPFLYVGGLAHWTGPYAVEALYICKTVPVPPGLPPAKCPTNAAFDLILSARNEVVSGPTAYPGIRLGLGTWRRLVEFTATGKCDVLVATANADCGF